MVENHSAELGEDAKEWQAQPLRADLIGIAHDPGEAEEVVGAGGDEAGDGPDEHGMPESAIAFDAVEESHGSEEDHGGDKDQEDEGAHGAEAVKFAEEAPDGHGGEAEDDGAALWSPTEDGGKFIGVCAVQADNHIRSDAPMQVNVRLSWLVRSF